jgi:hypothetical protein
LRSAFSTPSRIRTRKRDFPALSLRREVAASTYILPCLVSDTVESSWRSNRIVWSSSVLPPGRIAGSDKYPNGSTRETREGLSLRDGREKREGVEGEKKAREKVEREGREKAKRERHASGARSRVLRIDARLRQIVCDGST